MAARPPFDLAARLAMARGHLSNIEAHGNAEANAVNPAQMTDATLIDGCIEIARDRLEIDYDGDEPFIRSDSIESAVEAIAAAIGAGGQAVPSGWMPLTSKGERMTCPMPADETVVEVMLDDGTVSRAWYGCNLIEHGDWEFLPVTDDGEPVEGACGLADSVAAWRSLSQPHSAIGAGGQAALAASHVQVGDGVTLIAAERRRQIEAEGWTPEHDDTEHDHGDLAAAGSAYALHAADVLNPYSQGDGRDVIPDFWPFSKKWWKPSDDPVRTLEKAGALIAAEIDRLKRTAARAGDGQ